MELTELEKLFIMKAWENKVVRDSSLVNRAFYNAYVNANRKKNTRAIPLWSEKPKKLTEKEKAKYVDTLKEIKKVQEEEGIDWVKMLYSNLGIDYDKTFRGGE